MTRLHWVLLAAMAALAVATQVLGPHSGHPHWWDGVPGSYAVFGFAGCAAIVLLSKWAGKHLLQRREDYYDRR